MAEKAFAIYEILERVLIYTDRRTLLLSQCVCRTWKLPSSNRLGMDCHMVPDVYETPLSRTLFGLG